MAGPQDLKTLADRAVAEIAASADVAALEAVACPLPRTQGRRGHSGDEADRDAARGREAGLRRGGERGQSAHRGRARGSRRCATRRESRSRASASARTSRCRPRRFASAACIPSRDDPRGVARLRDDGLRDRRRARRSRPTTTTSRRSTSRRAIRRARSGTRCGSSNPLGDDPTKPLLGRTHTSPMQVRIMEQRKPPIRVVVPGPLLPVRGDRRDPREHPLPVRGARDRREAHYGRPQGRALFVRAADLREQEQRALPTRLLPVHGALGRDRVQLRRSARARIRSATPAAATAGSKPRAAAWSTPTCCGVSGTTRSVIRDSRSAAASSVSRW